MLTANIVRENLKLFSYGADVHVDDTSIQIELDGCKYKREYNGDLCQALKEASDGFLKMYELFNNRRPYLTPEGYYKATKQLEELEIADIVYNYIDNYLSTNLFTKIRDEDRKIEIIIIPKNIVHNGKCKILVEAYINEEIYNMEYKLNSEELEDGLEKGFKECDMFNTQLYLFCHMINILEK